MQTTLTAGLRTSYASPIFSSVTQVPNGIYGFPTAGLTSVSIYGTGFGPVGTPVAVTYSYPSMPVFSLINAAVSVADTVITGQMGPGCGANLAISVAVGLGATGSLSGGENVVGSSSAPNSTVLSYSPPLNNWSVAAAPHWYITPTSNLLTLGGNTINIKCSDTDYSHCYFGPSSAPFVVTLTSALRGVSVQAVCNHAAGNSAHMQLTCTNPAGSLVDVRDAVTLSVSSCSFGGRCRQ